jgi:hypothetical protein
MSVVMLWRQRFRVFGDNFASASHASVDAGQRGVSTWRITLVERTVLILCQVRDVLIERHQQLRREGASAVFLVMSFLRSGGGCFDPATCLPFRRCQKPGKSTALYGMFADGKPLDRERGRRARDGAAGDAVSACCETLSIPPAILA